MNETPEIRKRHNSSLSRKVIWFLFLVGKNQQGSPPPTIPFYFILFIYLTLLRKEIKISGENVVIKIVGTLFCFIFFFCVLPDSEVL